jgi:hypothetical protein
MFKKMYHTHKLFKSPYDESFMLHIYVSRTCKLPKSRLTIFSNKILYGVIFNCNLEEIKRKNIKISDLDQSNLYQYIFDNNSLKQEIYFPKNKFFATYRYTFPSVTLYPDMTIILSAETSFEPLTVLFTSEHTNKNDYYKCVISENLLTGIKNNILNNFLL